MVKKFSEDKLFKALSHPTRRQILRYIGAHGEASYSELAMIEPKSGVLYHHLKLLGDLIYQDERKIYRLTDKGYKALEFLENVFFEPRDTSIHRFLTPRWLLERIEGRKTTFFLLALYLISSISWLLENSYLPLFILTLPYEKYLLPLPIIALLGWLASTFLLTLFVRIIYERYINFFHLLVLNTIPFALINLSPILNLFLGETVYAVISLAVIQLYALLLVISNISVAGMIGLKKSAMVVIALHYISLLIYFGLIFMIE